MNRLATGHQRRGISIGTDILGILPGHEDPSDRDELRKDPASGSIPLVGKSALNRFELSGTGKARKTAAGFGKMDRLMADLVAGKHARPPAVDPEPPAGLTMAQTLLNNRKPNRRVKLRAAHPPPLPKPTRDREWRNFARLGRTARPLRVEHYSAAVHKVR